MKNYKIDDQTIDDELFEKKISSKKIFSGKIIELYFDKIKLPNNKIATREKVTHPGAVGIIPVNSQEEVFLVKQYRYPLENILIEIPAGKLDKNESPINCARRELKEEIGAFGGKLIHVSTFYTSPGFCDEILYLYLALDFDVKENNLDHDEFLQIIRIKLEDCLKLIKENKIKDAKTIIGILLAERFLGNGIK